MSLHVLADVLGMDIVLHRGVPSCQASYKTPVLGLGFQLKVESALTSSKGSKACIKGAGDLRLLLWSKGREAAIVLFDSSKNPDYLATFEDFGIPYFIRSLAPSKPTAFLLSPKTGWEKVPYTYFIKE